MNARRLALLVVSCSVALAGNPATAPAEGGAWNWRAIASLVAARIAPTIAADPLDDAISLAADAKAKASHADSRSDLDKALDFMAQARGALVKQKIEEVVSLERLARTPLLSAETNAPARNEPAAFRESLRRLIAKLEAALIEAGNIPIGYDVYMPSLAAEGDRLEGVVVAVLPEGRVNPNALEGADVAVYNGEVADTVKVGRGGRISPPSMRDFLPAVAVPLLFVLAESFQGSPAPAIPESCAVAPPVSGPPAIAHASDVVGRNGLIRVTGTNLSNITQPRLEYPNGTVVNLPDTDVGTTMERLIVIDRPLPKGSAKFKCTGPNGEPLEAPNATTNPTVNLQGPGVVQQGTTGSIRVGVDAACYVTLHGGEPQISLANRTVRVAKDGSANVEFKAAVTGAYTVTAAVDAEPPRNPDGKYITASAPNAVCTPSATGGTLITASTKVTTVDGEKPVAGAVTDLVIAHPGGISYTTVVSGADGDCTVRSALPGSIAPNLVNAYVANCSLPANNFMPVAMSFPAFFFGSACGGSSKKAGETVAGWDPHKWIDDFNAATKDVAEFEVTVYCDQPGKGGDKDAYEDGDVGHTFVQISGGGQSITGGFYPASGYSSLDVLRDATKDGKLVDDKDHPWDVKKTYKVKFADVEKMKKKWKEWKTKKYNLRAANCTDFVKDVCAAGGVTLPGGTSNWPSPMSGTSSSNPGAMGEELMGQGGTRK
jgi:hypothetical protein